ncbi:MAG: BatA and WFA domain-containing protein [Anaerolineae bacterium]|nr:BatA and WFA domain-containing protein [Anaerolineae bacterium]
MNFLTPLGFLGALMAIPIILLYMLRLRRREVTISSTFLWQQVLQDAEANTPWQRLRRNILLFLQLLILALLVFALARPYLTVPTVSTGQITLLLDASASMNATDSEGGITRFESAKRLASDIINTLPEGDTMTIIRVAQIPEVLIATSTDQNQLRNALAEAQPSLAQADWDAALSLAAGKSAVISQTLVIIGDGGLPENISLEGLGATIRYVPVGESSENVGISALATRRLVNNPPELFAQITNYGFIEAQMILTLWVDGERFTSRTVQIPAKSNLPFIATLPDEFVTVYATLSQSVNAITEDYLTVDNTAYAVSGASASRRVLLVTTGNLYIEQVLRSLPNIQTVRTDGATGIPADYDLYIFDGVMPNRLPDGDLFFINPPNGNAYFTVGAENEQTASPIVLLPNDPRLRYVDVEQLNLIKFREIINANWATPLLAVAGGAILYAGETDGRQVAILPFDLRESDLPLQVSYIVLMANLLEWFTPRTTLTLMDSAQVGDVIPITPPLTADAIRVTKPNDANGQTIAITSPTVVFSDTLETGIYRLELLEGGDVIGEQPFAVNLFSQQESEITPVPLEEFAITGTTLLTTEQEEIGQQELWGIFALLAILFLLVEWITYHQRLKVPKQSPKPAKRSIFA